MRSAGSVTARRCGLGAASSEIAERQSSMSPSRPPSAPIATAFSTRTSMSADTLPTAGSNVSLVSRTSSASAPTFGPNPSCSGSTAPIASWSATSSRIAAARVARWAVSRAGAGGSSPHRRWPSTLLGTAIDLGPVSPAAAGSASSREKRPAIETSPGPRPGSVPPGRASANGRGERWRRGAKTSRLRWTRAGRRTSRSPGATSTR